MNLLAVDIGNTDIKFGIFRDGILTQQWRASGTRTHPEKFSAMLRDSLARTGVDFGALVYTSVVPDIEFVFRKTIQYCFNLPDFRIFAVNPHTIQLPLDFSRYPLEQLGMDRLVNACSARLMYPDTALVVADLGTATTFDLVSRSGVYLGGAITPGLRTFMDSLTLKAPRLPEVSLVDKIPETLHMGTNTIDCIEAGLGLGYRGLMKELLAASAKALQPNDEFLTIATGGLAESVIRICGLQEDFQVIDPVLTLKGLYLLYAYNRSREQVGLSG
jgi:type III pantothenate kinase